MKIKSAEIVVSAVSPKQYPETPLPEIALVGRSNVGKSSTINSMLQRKKLARVSASPGKTRTINFYIINEEFHLVDLPGYGYAKVSKSEKASWGNMIETYLSSRNELQEVVLLVDIRHEPSADDRLMLDWIRQYGFGHIIVATKLDKIPKGRVQHHLKVIRQSLKMGADDVIVPVSSLSKQGIAQLWDAIYDLMADRGMEFNMESAPDLPDL